MNYFVEHKTYPYHVASVRSLVSIPHIHTHLEIIYVCRGKAIVQCDRKEYEVQAGDLFLAFPNRIHSYRTQGEVECFLGIFSAALTPLLENLIVGKIPSLPVLKKEQIPFDAEKVLGAILREKKSEDPYEKLRAMGDFISFLSRILPLFSYEEDSADYDSMQKILTYCAEHFTEEIALDTVAKELFLSKYYISHLFRKRMEMSFHDFLSYLRVNRACELLARSGSITEIALNSGFSSVRTFNRVFLGVTGKTPLQYRKELNPKNE